MKTPFHILAPLALAAAGLLHPLASRAVEIETTANDGFFVIPAWMPTSVASKNTPGSSAFVRHAMATTNEAGALFRDLAEDGKLTTNSASNLYAAFVRRGAINTNDLYDLVGGFDRYGAVTTNEAHNFYSAMSAGGVITEAGALVLSNLFDASVCYVTNAAGETVSHYGTISKSDAGYLYGSLARKDHITVTNAAALYACYNAYVERCYYLNSGMRNAWDTSVYGPIVPALFKTPADLTNRTGVTSRALYGLTNMLEIARNCTIPDFYCYRPSWPCDKFAISSSVLNRYDWNSRGTDLEWKILDPGIMPTWDWNDLGRDTETGAWYYECVRPLSMFYPDHFCPRETVPSGIDPNSKKGFIDSILVDLAYGIEDRVPFLYHLQDEQSTFANSVTQYFGTSESILSILAPTNTLQAIQPWMSAAGRMFSVMNRAYTANKWGVAVTNVRYSASATRVSSWTSSDGDVTITVDADGSSTFSPHSTIAKADWNVGAISNYHEAVSNCAYTGTHSIDIRIGDVDFQHGGNGVHQPVTGDPIPDYDVETFLDELGADFEGVVEFSFEKVRDNAYRCNCNGAYLPTHTVSGTFTSPPLKAQFVAARLYAYTQTPSLTADIGWKMRPDKSVVATNAYTLFAAYLSNDEDSDSAEGETYIEDYDIGLKASGGKDVAGYALTNLVNAMVANTYAQLASVSEGRWEDWSSPSVYAYVSADEARCAANVYEGSFALDYSDATFLATVTNGVMYDLKSVASGVTNTVVAGEVPESTVITTVSGSFAPALAVTDWSQTETDATAHRAVGDGWIVQRQDFDFESLRLVTNEPETVPIDGPYDGPIDGSNE